jgi:hypothetical protein
MRTGGGFKLFGEALFAFALGRWFTTTFFDFFWSSISAIALILIVFVGAFVWMSWTAEDLVAEKLRMEGWRLRSHLYVLSGAFAFGALGSVVQWVAYTVVPWMQVQGWL